MTEKLNRNVRVIHDLERAIRVWELVRAREPLRRCMIFEGREVQG
jgi:hypothetical protein